MVDAVRALTLGSQRRAARPPGLYYVVRALLWAAAILAVFGPLAVARYRRG